MIDTTVTKEYVDGYKTCAKELNSVLSDALRRNGGARTPQEMLAVLNEIISLTHMQNLNVLNLKEEIAPQPSKQTTIYMIVDNTLIH